MTRVRLKHRPDIVGSASQFNLHSLGSVFVSTREEMWEEDISNLEVFIEWLGWIPMGDAFRAKELITDDYNHYFFRPRTAEDRERGYTL